VQGKIPMSWGSIDFSTNLYYTSSYAYELLNRVRQQAHPELNASIGASFGDGHLQGSLWGKNLTNETYIFSALSSGFADLVTYSPPRQIGISLKYEY
jgi:iron complex outermembrane receptor protein